MKLLSLLQSVLAAFFGVQSATKHERDFTQSDSPVPFIVTAVIVFIVFILGVLIFVKFALV
ncbi:MAG: DUF2970 domain-containing protein [Pseudomonadota bacterium]